MRDLVNIGYKLRNRLIIAVIFSLMCGYLACVAKTLGVFGYAQ